MQYYMIEWDHEEPDEPYKVYLELDSRGTIRRKVDTPPVDPRQIAGSEGHVTDLNRAQFDDIWDQSRQMPDGFMGMFY